MSCMLAVIISTLLTLTYQWTIVHESLNLFPLTDINGWQKSDQSLPTIVTCTFNSMSMLVLDGLNKGVSNIITDLPPHFRIQLVIDLYFSGYWESELVSLYFDSDKCYEQLYNYDLLPTYQICNGGKFTGITLMIDKLHLTSTTSIQLITTLNEVYQDEGVYVRNVQVSVMPCHITCLTCFDSDSHSCSTCYSGVPTTGKCQCLHYFQPNTGCVDNCLTGYIPNTINICTIQPKLFPIEQYFVESQITHYYSWIKNTNPAQESQYCGVNQVFGVFLPHDQLFKLITISQPTQYLRIRLTIYMYTVWTLSDHLQFAIDNLFSMKIYYSHIESETMDNIHFRKDSSSKCADHTQSMSLDIVVYMYNTISPVINIKGIISSGATWAFRDMYVEAILCALNCIQCENSIKCQICIPSYKLYQGQCMSECPLDSIPIGNTCQGFDEEAKFSKYIDKAFFDFSTNAQDASEFFTSVKHPNIQSVKQVPFSYFPNKRVFGGALTWLDAEFEKVYTIHRPHYAIKLVMTVILGDSFPTNQYFAYSLDGLSENRLIKDNPGQNIVGKAIGEQLIPIVEIVNHQSTTFKIVVSCNAAPGATVDSGFCAISDYAVVVLYCDDFCPRCNNDNECIQCDSNQQCQTCFGISNDQCLSCYSGQYRILQGTKCVCQEYYYEDHEYNICRPCYPLCKQCTGQFNWQCTECTNSLTVLQEHGSCTCVYQQFIINQFNDCEEIVYPALDCHEYCLTCSSPQSYACTSCDPLLNRELNQSNCNCMFGYFQDGNQSVCSKCNQQQINNPECYANCGDSIVQWNEQCDDGNYLPWDGCNQCQFQCSQLCQTCINGKCDQCIEGYVLNGLIGCVAVCGDKLIFELEQCDDGNQIEYDGCHNCKMKCQQHCATCVEGVCWQCLNGYSLIQEICTKCGDGYFQEMTEKCDDGNLIVSDGCTNCIIDRNYYCISVEFKTSICFYCRPPCTQCILDENKTIICVKCATGYVLNQGKCLKCSLKCIDCIDYPNQCGNCLYPQLNCKLCESQIGLYSNIIEQTCYSKCGDGQLSLQEECDDYNRESGDGCSLNCKIEPGWVCQIINSQMVCDLIGLTSIIIEQPIIYSAQIQKILISFSRQVRFVDAYYKQMIQANLENISSKYYKIEIIEVNEHSTYLQDVSFELTIESYIYLSDPTLIVVVDNNMVDDYDRFIVSPKLFNVNNLQYLSSKEEQAIQTTIDINYILLYIIAGISSIQLLMGNVLEFINLLDLIQYLSYLRYINLQFPVILELYFKLFDIISIDPLLEALGIAQQINAPYIQTNYRFEYFNTNAYFFANISSVLFMMFCSYLIYFISCLIKIILIKSHQQQSEVKQENTCVSLIKNNIFRFLIGILSKSYKFSKIFHFKVLFQLVISLNYDLVFSSLLQLMYDDNSTTLQSLSNFIASVMVCLGQISIILYLLKNVLVHSKQMGNTIIIANQANNRNYYSFQYSCVLLSKNFAFLSILVVLQKQSVIQILLILYVQLLFTLYILLTNPFNNQQENKKTKVMETCIFITILTFIVYLFDEQYISMNTKNYMAWCQVGLISFIILYSGLFNIYICLRECCLRIQNIYHKLQNKQSSE